MKRIIAGLTVFLIIFTQFSFIGPLSAKAAVSNWIKGASIVPTSQTDFGSATFNQSLQNLKATGANYVALIVPYYQSNLYSTDIGPGWNTPTDASLASAIDYAHSIGLSVVIKMHNESNSGNWRAYINPSDRNTWFNNFNAELQHVGQLAEAHHVEMFVMNTEMVSVASSYINPDNTQRWVTLIGNMRKIYTGKLTYDANSTGGSYDAYQDEKESIGFWSLLDYAGLSTYYPLNTNDNSVASLQAQWDYWNNNDLKSFQQRVGKPLLFSEVGYRSADNAHQTPWVSSGGGYNPTEQVNDYEALLSYWNNYPYVAGVLWWDWKSNPNGGGAGDTDYTVQGKPALQTMTKWFTSGSSPTPPGGTPGGVPAITSTASTNPAAPQTSTGVAITANVKNSGGSIQNGLVDVEVYNSAGSRVYQQFFPGQTIAAGQTSSYTANWTAGPVGAYRVAVGIFNNDWTQNYSWNGNAAAINVAAAPTNPPPPNNPPPNNPPPNNPPPASSAVTNIWWPSNGATVNGVQPFKAMLEGMDVSQYNMYWQVDGGTLNQMDNSSVDYPHKEALVDLSSWHWQSTNRYTLNFVSKNNSGAVISQKSEVITVQ